MWPPRRRRRNAIARWRTMRSDEAMASLAGVEPATPIRVRRRHRAPTPRLPAAALAGARRITARRLSGVLLVAALAVAGVLALWRAPALRIQGAQVNGNTRLPAEEIYAASALHGAWSLVVDRAAAERRIAELPGVRRARVRVTWPARLWIGVEETELALAWQTEAGMYAIDETGRVVATVLDPASLPIVRDEAAALAGADAVVPPALLAAARAFAAQFGPLTLRPDVGFVARTAGGCEVRLGTDPAQAAEQARLLAPLVDHLTGLGDAVWFIDLRFPARPYYRLRRGADRS